MKNETLIRTVNGATFLLVQKILRENINPQYMSDDMKMKLHDIIKDLGDMAGEQWLPIAMEGEK